MPLVGALELGAHLRQIRPAASEDDWKAARAYVAGKVAPEDLVAFAPKWIDPVGRERFGPPIATVEREARADETRFARAFEVGIRGAHLSAFEHWRKADETRFGGVTVTTWENPAPAHVQTDLVSLVSPEHMGVSRGGVACRYVRARPESGGLGYGLGVPAERFTCPGGAFVAVSVVPDLNYVPHRCIYAPPAEGAATRLEFHDVHFGKVLHGHHALYVEAERNKDGPTVKLRLSANGAFLTTLEHRDGEGWAAFDVDTSALDGQTGELVAEVIGSGERRLYCFEADTR